MFSKRVRRILTLSLSDQSKESSKYMSEKQHTTAYLREDMASTPSAKSEDLPSPIKKEVDEVASRATQMVQVFSEENKCLRNQLEKCCFKMRHLQNVEKDLRNTQLMYDDLKSAFINREHKEKAMRLRLELEIAQLQNSNAELTEQIREAQDIISRRPKDELRNLQEEINKRDKAVEQLQKEGKVAKMSLQNVERLLKQKSSEIIDLKRQLERSSCNLCGCKLEDKQKKEEQESKQECQKGQSLDFVDQFSGSMLKSFGRDTRFLNNYSLSYQKLKSPDHSSELDASTFVPVLIELLKEKNAEIAILRQEISQVKSRPTEFLQENNLWRNRASHEENVEENGEACAKYTYSNSERRYSDLETAIKSLHVQLGEKDALIKILKCKYGETEVSGCQNYSSKDSSPFRSPSFTSQASSLSSCQDSGILTSSECCNGEMTRQDMKDVLKTKTYSLRGLEFENRNEGRSSTQQGEDQPIDHCWFV